MNVKRFAGVLMIAFAATGSALADSPMYRGGITHAGAFADKPFPPVLAWRWTNEQVTPGNTSSPAIVENTAYLGVGNRFVAIDIQTGALKWRYPASETIAGQFKHAPAVADGIVYAAATDGNLYAFRAETGRLLWTFNVRVPISSPPIVADGKVFFGANDGAFYGVDGKSGEPLYGNNVFRADDMIPTAPLYNDGNVIFASEDGILYSMRVSNAKATALAKLPDTMNDYSPIMANANIYIASGNSLLALNASNGRQRWRVPFSNTLVTAPAADANAVYVINDENKLYAFNNTGRQIWKKPVELPFPPSAPPTISGNQIIVATRRGLVQAYDTATGDMKWQYTVRPLPTNVINVANVDPNAGQRTDHINVTAAPVVANGVLVLVAEDGSVLGFSQNAGVDKTPPDVIYSLPEPGERMPGQPPLEFIIRLDDEGSGINPTSLALYLNDEKLDTEWDPVTGRLTHKRSLSQTNRPIADGRQNFRLEATDWAGNKLDLKWTVLVDNSLKRMAKKRYTGNQPTGGGGGLGPGGPGRGPGVPGFAPGGPGRPPGGGGQGRPRGGDF